MFKKPVNNWKTSSPLRTSDRKKFKQIVSKSFSITSEEAESLVPEGILSVKFATHLSEPGVAYLAPNGDPLWFSLGKGADLETIVPTVYTLWKHPKLLPFLSTPKAVIPILSGGADLMIPGVVHCPPLLAEGQLVSICKYESVDDNQMISPPLAVGRMAISSDRLQNNAQDKGKAVLMLHTWKDHLWDYGLKGEVPASVSLMYEVNEESGQNDTVADETSPAQEEASETTQAPDTPIYTSDEVSQLLRLAVVQCIAKHLGSLPASTFPIPATIFYTTHILPNRPNFPELVVPPSSAPIGYSPSSESPGPDPYSITIRNSSHKSLSAFLKIVEKSSLISTKAPQKHSAQTDVLITSVNALHPDVQTHHTFVTVGEVEAKAAKKTLREEKEREQRATASAEMEVRELWKPHSTSVDLFEGMGASTSNLYSVSEVRSLLNTYIATEQLVNPHDQAYINVDARLAFCIASKGKPSKNKNKASSSELESTEVEFLKRDELMKKVMDKMQSWYEVKAEGFEVVKKGKLSPIQVVTKIRQGRKASTLITGVEPFNIVPDNMAEDLRKICAGATSISPVPGKPANSGMEVLVQGKQSRAIVDYLLEKGVPKRWIEVHDLVGKK
ncbi:hypothetical protein BDP27DRAFT_1416022 [Rhodocollybia butyracea]|uniref:Eukaryotic translation initiation factor 2D n=1 Tax=Rhodocollybia butyracea TaxID=206335 RepID=A0A9P5PXX1_9AGAR|nr:hypothetical protein BDP27DRAFT_1416022 [Rhodocollybia butyracea]